MNKIKEILGIIFSIGAGTDDHFSKNQRYFNDNNNGIDSNLQSLKKFKQTQKEDLQ